MKKIKDFEEKDRLSQPLMVKEVRNGTTNKGAPYLTIIFQDNSGTIDGKYWDVKPEQRDLVIPGHVLLVNFEVLLYNKNLQLRINKLTEIDESELDMNEFVIASNQSERVRREKTNTLVSLIQNPVLRQLTEAMLQLTGEKYYTYPAASRIHHGYLGGLSEHSLSMAEMCVAVCEHYPFLNRDLLVSAALVHDIGKTLEMSGPVTTEYTLAGRMEGHISIANGWLTKVAGELGLEENEETIMLHHMILSHHGHYEFGSPVLPMLIEAEVLSMIDNLDARVNAIKSALDITRPGEWTQKMFSIDNRQFYRPKGA